jgi:benzoyl-CoA reductase/2-hydroxyglutaryl-CoA dehydratase subunit BcrC/BadD/HgdB
VIGDTSDISRVLRDPLAEARGAKLLGTPVVGFLSNNVPVEMIHAAGAFALQLPTAPGPTPLADRYLEAPFDPQARAALEQLLRGALRLVDLLVLPRAVDSFQRLYYYACELKRSARAALPELHLYDVLHTPWQTSADYNLARTEEFARTLSALTGRTLHDASLSASIARYNRLRDKLARLSERRSAAPAQLSGVHARRPNASNARSMPCWRNRASPPAERARYCSAARMTHRPCISSSRVPADRSWPTTTGAVTCCSGQRSIVRHPRCRH